ncbi:hypothetical protein NP233_g7616 [Leucocoprinus birnbaumii]|uniref:AB hydrolase-1 domain-containing protein n=1 Tax=Leucocoprinus birnbaumii TaxID=56174 RepID=A0AAD5VUD1_9AGAR|nr:hypothetical protein NP233_g7616 [Leucocoprinus birnbaumii]
MPMDASRYKDLTTSRGLNYHYYFSAAQGNKLTLLLLHGFPSLSYDWHNQVTYLEERGYGLIVPDMLGYGGTAKPEDPHQYKSSLIVQDLIDILDAEDMKQSVVIGHDWGSAIASRLANYHPDRFVGFGFLAVGYFAPAPDQSYEDTVAFIKQAFGKEAFRYQEFFADAEGAKLCEKNFDSFYSLIHAEDSQNIWPEYMSPLGATKKWVEENKQTELNRHIPSEDHVYRKAALQKGGLVGPMCWYKIRVSAIEREDTRQIPQSSYAIEKPVWLGLAEGDMVANPLLIRPSTEKWCKNSTIKSFSGSHWLLWDNKDEINVELSAWLETLQHTAKY